MKEQNVREIGSLLHPRAQHACAILPGPPKDFNYKQILVTGGSTHGDEIFDVTLRYSRIVANSMKVPRINHVLVALGQKVFALGGQREANDYSTLDNIEVFDAGSESWSLHSSKLLSKSTDGLAVTELPSSAVSCIKDCQCGVKSGARIAGGAEAQVKLIERDNFENLFCQDPSHSWLGLLLASGETDIFDANCAATLVGQNLLVFLNTLCFSCRLAGTCSSPPPIV